MTENCLRAHPLIEVKNLRKEYPAGSEVIVALKGINLEIMRGEICCIFGAPGSGKTALLNQLAGLERPTHGEVKIGGVCVSSLNEDELEVFRQRHIGFVFQSYNLLSNLTAAENVALPLMFRGIQRSHRESAAKELLCSVGLEDRGGHLPSQLSAEEQQRAGIARAFITKPDVVFAHEPAGKLNSQAAADVMNMICGLARSFHQTIVLVSHDRGTSAYAERIITLADGEIVGDERKSRRYEAPGDGCE